MEEVWKEINNYKGLYSVSNRGRIKSMTSFVPLIFSQSNGYSRVTLIKNGKAKGHLVHRLIAQAFILNPGNKDTVKHKDGNKHNNNVDNLMWMTMQENIQYTSKVNLARKMNRPIKAYNIEGLLIGTWNNIRLAGEELNISKRSIWHSAENNKMNRKYKLRFEYSSLYTPDIKT